MTTGIYKHNPRSKETREKIRRANIGKLLSEETKRKISNAHKGLRHSPNTEFKKGSIPWIKGRKISSESRLKMSIAHKNMSNETRSKMSKAKIGINLTEETKYKISEAHKGKKRSREHQRKLTESQRGPKSHRWKGGITPINHTIRISPEYKLWRETVFKRDDWTCIWCGEKGGALHVDHIKPFALYPELRFAIGNGRTLCVNCHQTTDTYGGEIKWPWSAS